MSEIIYGNSENSKYEANRRFTFNQPDVRRIHTGLAVEIGLNESIVFLQLEYLIAIAGKERDGELWVFESLSDLVEIFPFWSEGTCNRTIHSLLKKNLIKEANYNKIAYDRTRWFAINLEEASKLKSITVKGYEAEPTPCQNDTPTNQNDTSIDQNDAPNCQDETTIPKTFIKNSTDTSSKEKNVVQTSTTSVSSVQEKKEKCNDRTSIPKQRAHRNGDSSFNDHPIYVAVRNACSIELVSASPKRIKNAYSVAKKLIELEATVADIEVASNKLRGTWPTRVFTNPTDLQDMFSKLRFEGVLKVQSRQDVADTVVGNPTPVERAAAPSSSSPVPGRMDSETGRYYFSEEEQAHLAEMVEKAVEIREKRRAKRADELMEEIEIDDLEERRQEAWRRAYEELPDYDLVELRELAKIKYCKSIGILK